jgi:hypothetical protein
MSALNYAGRGALALSVILAVGCGSDDNNDGTSSDAPPGKTVDAGSGFDAAFWAAVAEAGPPKVKPDLGYEVPHDGGIHGETMCDGIDNDGDGIIDNVDLANDGICDCLKIGTIGKSLHGSDETFAAWLGRRSGGVTELAGQQLTAELLAPIQALIIQDVRERAYTQDEINVLEKWVSDGGGIFALTGYTADINTNVNALLAPYGINYGVLLVLVNPLANESVPVDTWYPDPVTEGITKVGVVSAYEVQGGGKILAEGNDLLLGKQVMFRSVEHGKGKVLAWGDEWITYNSEWVTRTDYQVARLWQNSLQWLGGEKECKVPPPILL